MTEIILPWPDPALNPNARKHWRAKSTKLKAARSDAFCATKEAGVKVDHDGPITLITTYHPPDRRGRDLDNAFAAGKAHRDGIADALGVDDVRFRHSFEWGEPVKGGRVVVRIA